MSFIEGNPQPMGPEPAAPADPTHTYADTEAGGGAAVEAPQDVVVEDAPETPAEPDTFDRSYVEELRRENAKWRTRAHEYESTFSDMDESLRQGWMEVIQLANSGDPDAMDQLAQALGFEVEAPEVAPPAETPQQLTAEEYRAIAREEAQALRDAEAQERAQKESIDAVATEGKSLGYEPGSRAYVELLYEANEIDPKSLPSGKTLLQVAHERLQSEKQKEYDDWIAKKTADAGGSPVAPSGNGASPGIAVSPKTWDEARDALHERLSNI